VATYVAGFTQLSITTTSLNSSERGTLSPALSGPGSIGNDFYIDIQLNSNSH
jgi:hypothetical protein